MDTTRRLITFFVGMLFCAGGGAAFLSGGWSGLASSVAGASLNSNNGFTHDSQSLGSSEMNRRQGWWESCKNDAAKRSSPVMIASVKVGLAFDCVGVFPVVLSVLNV